MPCTSIPDPQSCLRKMLKMNFMIVIMRLGDEIDFWYAGFSNTCEARKIQAPQAQCKHPSRVSFRFAPINPVGLIAQLVARLLDIHSRLPKLLMLVEKTKTLTDFFFWMILGATWWKHFDAKMFSCFAVSQGFLPTSSGSTIFFFIFRIVRRRDSPMDNNLAHISQQVAPQAVGQGCWKLPFIGFQWIWIWMIQNPILQKPRDIPSSSQFVWEIFARSLGILSSHLLPFGTLDPWGNDKGKEGHLGMG